MDRQTARMVEQLHRRVTMAAGRGTVAGVDDSGQAQLLQVQIGPYELRTGLPRAAEYGFSSVPQIGADAVMLFLAGDRSNGLVVATGDQRYRLRALQGGEVAIWDDQGQHVKIGRSGIVVNGAGQPITVQGDLRVTGEVTAHYGGASVTLGGHKHGGVQTGSGTTSAPTTGT